MQARPISLRIMLTALCLAAAWLAVMWLMMNQLLEATADAPFHERLQVAVTTTYRLPVMLVSWAVPVLFTVFYAVRLYASFKFPKAGQNKMRLALASIAGLFPLAITVYILGYAYCSYQSLQTARQRMPGDRVDFTECGSKCLAWRNGLHRLHQDSGIEAAISFCDDANRLKPVAESN